MTCRQRWHSFAVSCALVIGLAGLALTTPGKAEAVTACPYACSWPQGARADVPLIVIRNVLILRRASLPTAHARLWLDRAVASLNTALQTHRWSGGKFANTPAGAEGMWMLRVAVGRLYWPNESLRNATRLERSGIIATMWYVAAGRYNTVRLAGQTDSGLLWRTQYDLWKADQDFLHGVRVRASLGYHQAFVRLLGAVPA
jgi:hypothetical protein